MPVNPPVGVNVTVMPLTLAVPLVALTTLMLEKIPLMLEVKSIAAAVFSGVCTGLAGTETVGAGGNVVTFIVTVTGADCVPQGPVAKYVKLTDAA